MKEINLRDFYPWYMEDVMVEVTEEVAEELLAGQRYIKASRRRVVKVKSFAPRQIQRRSFAALAITLSRKIF